MLRRWHIAPGEMFVVVILALLTTLIFGLIVHHPIFNDVFASDYTAHIQFARDILQNGKLPDVHLLFQGLILGFAAILPISLETAAWFVAVLFDVICTLILYALIRRVLSNGWRAWLISATFALALMLVTPITLLTLRRQNLYFGYIAINVVHNPTIVLLKPFALLLFVFALGILNRSVRWNARTILVGFLLVLFSLLAKPNYVLVLLPALLVLIAYRLYRRDTATLKTLIVALILPMIGLLALQYVLMFVVLNSHDSQIIFAPLAVLYVYDHSRNSLVIKFSLSILFPVAVYLLYWRQAIRDLRLNLAWLSFFAGAGQMYLFAESGGRLPDANFWWSAQIGLFILFVISTLFLLEQCQPRRGWRAWLSLGIFALHFASGVIFILVQIQAQTMQAWW